MFYHGLVKSPVRGSCPEFVVVGFEFLHVCQLASFHPVVPVSRVIASMPSGFCNAKASCYFSYLTAPGLRKTRGGSWDCVDEFLGPSVLGPRVLEL